jgi:8-oxo-dGTP pyrophosphatase MutT (NUDIX family)
VREVQEETGIEAMPLMRIGTLEFDYRGETLCVDYYLMKYIRAIGDHEQRRRVRLCLYDEALAILSFEDAKNLLRKAWPIIERLRQEG